MADKIRNSVVEDTLAFRCLATGWTCRVNSWIAESQVDGRGQARDRNLGVFRSRLQTTGRQPTYA